MGKVVSKVTGALGLTADPTTGQGAMNQSLALQRQALERLDKIKVPTVEEQEIALANPELILSTPEERLKETNLAEIAADPMLKGQQIDALEGMSELADQGYAEEDRARMRAMQRQVGSDEQARQASILQSMAERGALDSGAQLAAQLSSSQGASNRAAEQADRLAMAAADARRSALGQQANMAGNIRSQDYGEQANVARARDAISQFNAGVSARDTAARQANAQQIAATANQQEMANKGLIQQNFQNQFQKATGAAQALGNMAAGQANQAQMQAQAAQNQASAIRGMAIAGGKAAMGKPPMKNGGIKKYANGGISAENGFDGVNEGPMMSRQSDPLAGILPSIKQQAPMMSEKRVPQLLERPVRSDAERLDDRAASMAQDVMADPIQRKPSLPMISEVADQYTQEKTPVAKKEREESSFLKDMIMNMEMPKQNNSPLNLRDANRTINPKAGLAGYYEDGGVSNAGETEFIGHPRSDLAYFKDQPQNSIEASVSAEGAYYNDGGMAYEDGGEGTIINSGMESYSGDYLEDRINDGEMVLNLKQQEHLNDLLQELMEHRQDQQIQSQPEILSDEPIRVDEQVDMGMAQVNEPQQQALFETINGERPVEALPEEDVIETKGMKKLLKMLGSE